MRAKRTESPFSGKKARPGKGEELTTTPGMYREMEMTFWLEKAEAAMAEVG